MNIFGEGFPPEIIAEVSTRQKVYGSGFNSFRDPSDIKYINANNSWCKLSSGVDVEDFTKTNNKSISGLGVATGNALAKSFVLLGGTIADGGPGVVQRAGLSSAGGTAGTAAYGIGGLEFGYRPMMGITNASIQHENRGSLRRAEVKIKAHNKEQFDIIDVLYLRIGFFVLLEWGHTLRINGGVVKNDASLTDDFLNKGALEYDSLLEKMQKTRLSSGGNYDAMLAKVSNFSWTILPDGSYDITVKLVSIGDVIESLKANTLLSSPGTFVEGKEELVKTQLNNIESEKLIDIYAAKSTIGSFLYFCRMQLTEDAGSTVRRETPIQNGDQGYYVKLKDVTAATISAQQAKLASGKDFPNLPFIDTSIFDPNVTSDAYVIPWDNWGNEYYVRLGTFLKFLENSVVITANKKAPLLKFDTEIGTNLMYVHPLQVSADPRVCMVNKVLVINGTVCYFGNGGNAFLVSGIYGAGVYGDIMNIYLSSAFILRKLDELKDDQNKVLLIDFLKGILQGANSALGGLNSLDVFVDESTNTVKVIDQNPLPDLDGVITYINGKTSYPKLSKDPAVFNLYKDGFVRNFDFVTEMSNEYSTMVTVAAASDSAVVGENDTALSKINLGLGDRWKNEVTNGKAATPASTTDNLADLEKNYKTTLDEYLQFIQTLSPSIDYLDAQELNAEEVDAYKDTLTNLIQMDIQIDKIKNKKSNSTKNFGPGSGFIPFNLTLTIDGLSGMKINQKFLVNSNFLPSNYPNYLTFLIKNITHTIENNKWITKLESYCVSAGENNIASSTYNPTSSKKKPPVNNNTNVNTNNNITNNTNNTNITKKPKKKGKGKKNVKDYNKSNLQPVDCSLMDARFPLGKENVKPSTGGGPGWTLSWKFPTKGGSWTATNNKVRQDNIQKGIIDFFTQKLSITNPYAIIALIGVSGKESKWIPKNEGGRYPAYRLTQKWPQLFAEKDSNGKYIPLGVKHGQTYYQENDLGKKYDNWSTPVNKQKPESIVFNLTYCCKTGNGDEASGDGWKYRGRGFHQMTFKGTYEWVNETDEVRAILGPLTGKNTDKDIVKDPDLVNTFPGLAAVVWYVQMRGKATGDKTASGDASFLTKLNGFTSACEALQWLAAANHGFGMDGGSIIGYNNAVKMIEEIDLKLITK